MGCWASTFTISKIRERVLLREALCRQASYQQRRPSTIGSRVVSLSGWRAQQGTPAGSRTMRHVYFAFHYKSDIWRVNQVRNSGLLFGAKSVGFADRSLWERTKS